MSLSKIGFGGGCHWCTEGVFSIIKGVKDIDQGWIASNPPCNELSEAVIIQYDPKEIKLAELIKIHLHTHACTSNHSMRGKYRSAIYTFIQMDSEIATATLAKLSVDFQDPIITKVLPFLSFKASSNHYQDYYQKNPKKPFCETYLTPKIQLLMKEFGSLVEK